MGSVYRCHNRSAHRILAAVKVLDPAVMRYPDAQARFIREAEILFSLDHPNIVKVRNVRTDVMPPYLEMEFVEGESLETRLNRGALPPREALEVMAQCASALAYMHAKGVRHRDIKPANLLVQPDGVTKLVDFGLAMETEGARITQQGMAFGTVSYAPPEWITPESLDPAMWDLYALGVVFYEMLTGGMAFPVSGDGSARQQAMKVIVAKQGHPALDPGEAFSGGVRQLVRDMTEPDPEKRISSMAEVEARIRELRRDPSALPPPRATPVPSAPAHTVQIPRTPEPAPTVTGGWSPVRLAAMGGLAALAVVALFGAGAAAVAVGWLSSRGRAVHVVVEGEAPFDVALDGRSPDRVEGRIARFRGVRMGSEVELAWAVGEAECTVGACFGSAGCPGCAQGTGQLAVERGRGPLRHVLAPSVQVELDLRGLPPAARIDGRLAGQPAIIEGSELRFSAVPVGEHALRLALGRCPGELPEPCWRPEAASPPSLTVPEGACEGPCAVLRVPMSVPGAPSALDVSAVSLLPPPPAPAAPAPAPEPELPEPVREAPEPAPEPAPPSAAAVAQAGPRVTTAQFAAWLEGQPEWQPDGASGRRQGAGYLADWSGASPPDGASPLVESASYRAARAYCASRGSDLAALDAVPSVADSYLEWRLGERPDLPSALGQNDGKPERLTTGVPNVLTGTVFRCAR